MTRKRIQYTPDDSDKYTLEEMTEKKKKYVKGQQTKEVVVVGITNEDGEKERNHYWYYK
jgi:hypothetical protein